MKKVLSVLVAIILCIGLIPMTVSAETVTSGTCGNNLTWSFDEASGVLSIAGTGAMNNYSFSEMEWGGNSSDITKVIIAKGVTSIGEYAFCKCQSLTTVSIPGSLTSIGEGAFYQCKSLTAVRIPNFVTSIGKRAFAMCSSLTDVSIPNSVTSIGMGAFSMCKSLTTVSIPDSVTSIGDFAFSECVKLTEIKIPCGITEIPDHCFFGCSCLISVIIPKTLKTVSTYAFYDIASFSDVYYQGSNKSAVSVANYNDAFNNATWHLNAIEYYNEQIITDSGSLSVIYSVAPSYTVTIPTEVKLGDDLTVSAENVVLLKGKKLAVFITETSDANNDFKLKTTEGAELTYTVKAGDTPVSVGTAFLTVDPESSASGSVTLSFVAPTATPQFAGEYEGTVTFYFSVE